MADLVLRSGHIIDPVSGRDEAADIAFGDGKIAGFGRDLAASDAEIIDVSGLLVVPGLMPICGSSTRASALGLFGPTAI